VLVVLIVVLLASAAILWPKFSKYREDFETTRRDLAAAALKVRALERRPSIEEHEALQKGLGAAREELETVRTDLAESDQAREAELERIAGLELKLADAIARADGLADELRKTGETVASLAAEKEKLEADLLTTVQSYENARRAASGKEDLLDKLDATAKKLSAAERALAAEQKIVAEKNEAVRKLQGDLEKAGADIDKRDKIMSMLRKELAEIPIMPLPEELAKEKYHEYLNRVAEHTDRESRISTLFRAKIALAGSAYEDKADAQWRREMKMKDDDLDRAARLVYDDVNTKVRIHPDAHDENVLLLQEALEKVAGSRFEKIIQQLIDREHELKAVGR